MTPNAMANIFEFLMNIFTPLRQLFRRGKRWWWYVGSLLLLAVVVVFFFVAHGGNASTPSSAVATTRPVGPKEPPHGLDLAAYCMNFNFPDVDHGPEVYCRSKIDLSQACLREHPDATTWAYETPDDLYSALCYDSHKRSLGGISDMTGFCRAQHINAGSRVIGTVHDKAWQCQMQVDISAACSASNNRSDLEGVFRNGNWECEARSNG